MKYRKTQISGKDIQEIENNLKQINKATYQLNYQLAVLFKLKPQGKPWKQTRRMKR